MLESWLRFIYIARHICWEVLGCARDLVSI